MATDMEIGIRMHVDGIEVEAGGSAVLPVTRFGSILRENTDEKLQVEVDAQGVAVRGERSDFSLPAANPDEFPSVASFEEEKFHKVPVRLCKELIRRTLFATDTESSRYALGGVLLEMESKSIVAVGTDGRRLAKMEGPGHAVGEHSTGDANIIVPTRSMQLIERYGTETWPPDQQEQWQQLTRLTNEAKAMIDHLVSFAGLLIKRGDLYWTGVDFASLVHQVVNTLMPTALSRQVSIHIKPTEKIPLIVGDKMRLAEAIHHLVHNAIKFNHLGGKVNIHYWQKDNRLTFQIESKV